MGTLTLRRISYLSLRVVRWIAASCWLGANNLRYLISTDPAVLSSMRRLQRKMLIFFLGLPDRYYQRSFDRFEAGLRTLSNNAGLSISQSGIMFMIGTLGPGGAERQFVLTIIGLAQRQFKSLRITAIHQREEWQRFFVPHLEEVGLKVTQLERDFSPGLMPHLDLINQFARGAPRHLAEASDYLRTLLLYKPAIAHFWLDECNIKGGMAALAAGVPRIVLGMRSAPPLNFGSHQPYMREGYRWLLRQPGVIALNNSKAGARSYEEWLSLPAGTIQVIRNGFEFNEETLHIHRISRTSYRQRFGISENVLLVGTVIRLTEEKRPMLWLEIACAVREELPDVRFLMVGDGALMSDVAARVVEDDLRDYVSVSGYETAPLSAIAAMDLFLLTSRIEGLPTVLEEAQALGVPVVTTNVGGAAETVMHGVTGWVLESDQVKHVARDVVRILQDAGWRKSAAEEGRRFVRDTFAADRMVDETVAVYGLGLPSKNGPIK